jgi:hypothetical protein
VSRRATGRWTWAILAAWAVVVLATQAWPSWETGISELFASDVQSYERIADAAPGLPSSPLPAQHAERFPAHWLVGTVSDLTGADLHLVYRVFMLLCLLGTLLVVRRALVSMRVPLSVYTVCIGCVAASAYPMRYLLAAPGMLSDAVFLLGLAVVSLGFVERHDAVVVLGVAVAALGRQSAVPLAVAAAVGLVLTRKRSEALRPAMLVLGAGIGIFVAEWLVARSFSSPDVGSFTILSSLDHPVRLVTRQGLLGFDARAFLGLLVPLGLITGAWLRGFRPPLVPVLLAASVVIQPLLLEPRWVGPNETRLAALAIPALAVAAGCQLRTVELPPRTVAIVVVAILLASFHARYSSVGIPSSAVWAAFSVTAALAVTVATGWPRLAEKRASLRDVRADT